MSLDEYKGKNSIGDRLSKAILSNRLSHAYIIEGDRCVDKMKFAKEIIKAVVCENKRGYGCDSCIQCRKIEHDNYEDLYFVYADDNSVKDGMIAKLHENLKNKPTGGDWNFAVIADADTITPTAQNRFLKTLEEPNPGTVIFLLSENTDNLLPTIRSRCITYRIGDMGMAIDNQKIEVATKLIEMIREKAYFCDISTYIEKNVKNRKEALELIDGMERVFHEHLMNQSSTVFSAENIIKNVTVLELARRQLMLFVNYKYVIRNLVLKIGG